MKVKRYVKKGAEYKTARQWALEGRLPKDGVTGTRMWTNSYCTKSCIYFAPDEVREAASEELTAFWQPERDRRNKKARLARKKKKEDV